MVFHSLNLVRAANWWDFKFTKCSHSIVTEHVWFMSGTVLGPGYDTVAVLSKQKSLVENSVSLSLLKEDARGFARIFNL